VNPDQPVSSQRDEVDLVTLWRVIWRYKMLVGSVAAVFALAAAVIAMLMTPIFRAEVVITDARESNSMGAGLLSGQLSGLASLAGVNLGAASGAERDARAVLKSRHLIEEFIERNSLLPVLLQKSRKPPTLWRAVNRFQSSVLSIREDLRQGVAVVGIEWTDPTTASSWANGFVALANDVMRTRALQQSQRNITYLNEQVAKTNVVELQRVMYSLIEGETKTLMVANGRIEYAFTVVDPAVPPEIRASPKRTVIVLIGLFLGLLFGAIAAFWRNALMGPVSLGQPGF
jgi:uncharacterized protein involved in exopolysaccharide biosynthesis